MSQSIMRHFPDGTRVTRPTGGTMLWALATAGDDDASKNDRIDSLKLYKLALKAGITLTPGHIFSAKEQYCNFIRLSTSFWSPRAERAIERLGEIIRNML